MSTCFTCLPIGLRYTPLGYRWAGGDSAWEQEKLEATLREMLDAKRGDESHLSSARFVSLRFASCTKCLEVDVRNWDASKQV